MNHSDKTTEQAWELFPKKDANEGGFHPLTGILFGAPMGSRKVLFIYLTFDVN